MWTCSRITTKFCGNFNMNCVCQCSLNELVIAQYSPAADLKLDYVVACIMLLWVYTCSPLSHGPIWCCASQRDIKKAWFIFITYTLIHGCPQKTFQQTWPGLFHDNDVIAMLAEDHVHLEHFELRVGSKYEDGGGWEGFEDVFKKFVAPLALESASTSFRTRRNKHTWRGKLDGQCCYAHITSTVACNIIYVDIYSCRSDVHHLECQLECIP